LNSLENIYYQDSPIFIWVSSD